MEADIQSDHNPFRAPQVTTEPSYGDSEAQALRRKFLSHEASVKTIGLVCAIGGFCFSLAWGALLVIPSPLTLDTGSVLLISLAVAVGVLVIIAGFGMRTLRPWGRIAGSVVVLPGLLGFPYATILVIYILYLLLSRKGKMVFSDEYREIMAQTPHIRARSSVFAWIILLAIILLFGLFTFGL